MSNFTDFFPAASGGGGGFTKRLKWTTARGLDDANYNNAASYTVNPATDLGLSDGDSVGFLMVSGGYCQYGGSTSSGSKGGKVLTGTRIITNASTNLVLTPGVGGTGSGFNPKEIIQPTQSTITGGLTLTTADGTNAMGWGSFVSGSSYVTNGSQGFYNYGNGGGSGNWATTTSHGFGTGGVQVRENQYDTAIGSDGAILLFY